MLRHLLCLVALAFIGCGADSKYVGSSADYGAESTSDRYGSFNAPAATEIVEYDFDIDGINDGLFEAADKSAPSRFAPRSSTHPVAAETPHATAGRKIIYNADIRMVVTSLPEFLELVRKLIVSQGGFIGSSTETGMDGSNPSATLVVRVPSAGYQPILIELDELGVVEQRSENSRDVTAEFVDVEARIRNKEREEVRLLELLAEAEGKLKEILEVERELSRVRGEIERAQGQMNVLRDQIDLATITINASQRSVYTPPKKAAFGDRLSAAWGNSLTNLADFGSRAAIEVTAFVPWLVVWVPVLGVLWLVWRVIRRKLKSGFAKLETLWKTRKQPAVN